MTLKKMLTIKKEYVWNNRQEEECLSEKNILCAPLPFTGTHQWAVLIFNKQSKRKADG